ncbi:DNA polymerase III subunit alpha [Lacticaseibacillus zhaodongensis]|uniref:DNA polymerase III subunit alpha n=1 Tax=Lacticaseibacillus zhaodongensis TaxID=2668065 RepID=UPI0018AF5BF4|nr:DNA polymerase III subunit alpha [Lacticaseibacillus zhaodongensis]
MSFTHLRVLTSGTLLASPIRVEQLVSSAKAAGYTALAITDVNVLYNILPFYEQMRAAELVPLIGMQCRLATDDFILIALNQTGYKHLLRISTAVQMGATSLDELPDFTGLACISSDRGALARAFTAGDGNAAVAAAEALRAKHPSRFAIGVSLQQLDADLVEFARVHSWTALPIGDVRELTPADAQTRQLLMAIRKNEPLRESNEGSTDYGLGNCGEIEQMLRAAGMAELIAACTDLVAACQLEIEFKDPQLPHFPVPDGQTTGDYLCELATTGLRRLLGGVIPDAYTKRLDHELAVIGAMGFDDYFLIVQDIVAAAKKRDIMTGPGRGSAAGSLVAYALGITMVDPLRYGLLFERFLNPNRGQMPDIDLDVEDTRRGDVLEYIRARYGDAHTAQIMASSTFGARQALRDTASAMRLPQFKQDALMAALPHDQKHLRQAVQDVPALANLLRQDEETATVVRAASAIEGLPRAISTHAAGIVLAAGDLNDIVSLQKSSVGIGVQTQLAKEGVERVGLLKIDILGLRTLSILRQMLAAVQYAYKTPLDVSAIALDDQETLALFARGASNGVFQFESRPMRSVLKKVKPRSFEDVVATAALYRPGPMQYIDEFTRRMHGQVAVHYDSPLLEPILAPTYGVIVYQEQVMQVASSIGGFSMAEADDLRRAMSKKKQALIDAGQDRFIIGAAKNGLDAAAARKVYAAIEQFAGYGFNRSHAVAYGMLAFWMAYVKAHYPLAFYQAELNANLGNASKTREFVSELRAAHISLRSPSVLSSGRGYRIVKGNLLVGFGSIHGLRRDFVTALLQQRQDRPFTDLQSFLLGLDNEWLSATVLTPLIAAGAMDELGCPRGELLASIDSMCSAVELAGGSPDLLAALWPRLTPSTKSPAELRRLESDTLGFYLHGHPADEYARLRSVRGGKLLAQLRQQGDATVVVLVDRLRTISTKSGSKMAFATVSDSSGSAEVTIFPETYLQSQPLTAGTVYLMRIYPDRKREDDGQQHYVARNINDAAAANARLPKQLFLNLTGVTDAKMKTEVLHLLQDNHGQTQVIIVSGGRRVLLAPEYAVTVSPALLTKLGAILGTEAVAISPATHS